MLKLRGTPCIFKSAGVPGEFCENSGAFGERTDILLCEENKITERIESIYSVFKTQVQITYLYLALKNAFPHYPPTLPGGPGEIRLTGRSPDLPEQLARSTRRDPPDRARTKTVSSVFRKTDIAFSFLSRIGQALGTSYHLQFESHQNHLQIERYVHSKSALCHSFFTHSTKHFQGTIQVTILTVCIETE